MTEVHIYSAASAIEEVSRESASSQNGIRIIEMASMGEIMPYERAERIRQRMRANRVQVRQLTPLDHMDPWTSVDGFVDTCMQVRRLGSGLLEITSELLIFDDTVAAYQLKPEPRCLIIKDADYARQQADIFDIMWEQAEPLVLQPDGSTGAIMPDGA